MKSSLPFIVITFFIFVSFGTYALAQSAFNGGGANGGAVIPDYDSRTCDGTIEGAIRYNSSASPEIEFCDGSSWVGWGS